MEQYQDAAVSLVKYVERNSASDWALLHLAAPYGHLGRQDEAQSTFKKFLALREKTSQVRGTYTLERLSLYGVRAETDRIREGHARVVWRRRQKF